MVELALNKVVKSYGFKKVLDGFDIELKTGERVALIGPNGSGKTTIFKMIVGDESVTSGNIFISKGASIGMLSQIPQRYDDTVTVEDVVLFGKKQVLELERKMHDMEEKLANSPQDKVDSLLGTYGRMQEDYESLGGYQLESDISKVCNGFNIDLSMLKRKYNTLSGGEKTIVNFASLILSEPSILLLDEPTNHIDIDTREILEEALSEYDGTVLFISHDRYFIDKLADEVFEISNHGIRKYIGNYSDLRDTKLRVASNNPISKKYINTLINESIFICLIL